MNSVHKAVLVPYETYQRYINGDAPHSDTIPKKESLITKDPKKLLGKKISSVIDPPSPSKECCNEMKVSENSKQKRKRNVNGPSNIYKKAT
jgi:hypothetical protein